MFANASRDAAICIRCQLRLIRKQLSHQRLSKAISTPPSRPFASLPVVQPHPPDQPQHRHLPESKWIRPTALRSLRGRQIEKLNENVLGKTAEVLILRDEEDIPRQSRTAVEETAKSKAGQSPLEVLDQIFKEQEATSDEDVYMNLERFRSAWTHKSITLGQWTTLRERIQESFTAHQLTSYLAHHAGIEGSEHPSLTSRHPRQCLSRKAPGAGSILYSAWIEGETKFMDNTDTKLKSKSFDHERLPAKGSKPGLADRIMKQCWGFSIADKVGELDIVLHPRDLSLLLLNDNILKAWVERRNVRLDLSRSRHYMRITADCQSCYSFLKDLESYLSKIVITPLHLPSRHGLSNKDGNVDSDFCSWVSEKTGALVGPVEVNDDGSLLQIAHHEKNQAALDARRMILVASQEPDASPKVLSRSSSSQPTYLYPVTPLDGAWIEKQKSWARLMRSRSLDQDFAPNKVPLAWDIDLPYIRTALAFSQFTNKQSLDLSRITERLHAAPGYILTQVTPDSHFADHLSTDPFVPGQRRMFSTAIPGALPFLSKLPANDEGPQTRTFRLVPAKFDMRWPTIELHVRQPLASNAKNAAESPFLIASMYAVLGSAVCDLSLPQNAMDLRITRSLVYKLPGSEDNHSFAENLVSPEDRNFQSGRRFVPSQLDIEIPNHLAHPTNSQSTFGKKEAHTDSIILSSSTSSVPYLIQSYDYSDIIECKYNGHRLRYHKWRSVYSGAKGELQLSTSSNPVKELDSDKDWLPANRLEKFLQHAYDMAKDIEAAAYRAANVQQPDEPYGETIGTWEHRSHRPTRGKTGQGSFRGLE